MFTCILFCYDVCNERRRVSYVSIVVGTITSSYGVMSGDSKALNLDGSTYSDNFSKVFKVNEFILIGFTGSAIVPKTLNEHGILSKSNNTKPSEYAKELFHIIGKRQINAQHCSNILIIGKESSSKGYVSYFTTESMEMELDSTLNNGQIFSLVLPPSEMHKEFDNLNEQYKSNIKRYEQSGGIGVEDVLKEQSYLVKKVSEQAASVNNKCESLIV